MSKTRTCAIVYCRCGVKFRQRKAIQAYCSRRCAYDAREDIEDPMPRFMDRVARSDDGCWIWTGKRNNNGYGLFSIRGRYISAHRWSLATHIKTDIPRGMCVLHSCDVPACVNPLHLRIGTMKDNMQDASAKRRISRSHQQGKRGSDHNRAKLTEADVREIRESSETARALAAKFDVHISHIHNVRRRVTWSHIH